MPPVVVSAFRKLVWVSIALPGVPIPVPALIKIGPATMSAPASAPTSLIAPFETRVTVHVVLTLCITIESGDCAALVRLPTVKIAAPSGSVKLMVRNTPGTEGVKNNSFVGCSKGMMLPLAKRMREKLLPGVPSSSKE
jgi:hypothetical protein